MHKIKVLEMIDQPFLGGGQINLLSLAESLDKEKFKVSVCSQAGGPLGEALKARNIPHFPANLIKKFSPRTLKNIKTLLRESRFDILHTHGGVAGFYGRWAAHRVGTPVIVHTLHGIHYLHYRNIFLKYAYVLLERWFSRFSDALIFVSGADREKGIRHRLSAQNKMEVIKNGIDFSQLKSLGKHEDLKKCREKILGDISTGPLVGTVARLHRQKGISFLLKAAGKIQEVIPDVKIVIVGGGPWQDRLNRLNQKLQHSDCVRILGERPDAHDLLALFDVFVLPSLWEGLPYVLLEAAALGKPVVATDVDGSRELIKNGETGLLVPSSDPAGLAQAVITLLLDREKASALGANFKRDLSQKYTLSHMVEQTQELYERLYRSVHR